MIKLTIQGMSCQHCVAAVTRALEAVPGVTKVLQVNLAGGEALLDGTPDPEALTKAVEEEGYSATVAS